MSEISAPSGQLFLGRQPILDRDQQLVAYELLFRRDTQNAANVTDGVMATATVIANAFTELGIIDALGDCRGFINVDQDFLFSDVLELLPVQTVVLEILETVPPTPEVLSRCRELKTKGFALALDDVIQVSREYTELIDLVEIIKVDLQPLTPDELHRLTGRLKPFGKQLLAEKVDSHEQLEQCMKLGYQLFQGYHFAKPTIIAGKKLDHSQLALMNLMGLLFSDADTLELESAFKPEPGLTVTLLRMTNSVGAGTKTRISSLRNAIDVLGRRQLQRWLQLLMFTSGTHGGTRSPLLQLAATRGQLMELMSRKLQGGSQVSVDDAFMVGIMSLMPALVGLPIADIVAPLSMPAQIGAALCQQSGVLGDLLKLAIAAENGDPREMTAAIAALPGLDIDTLNHCVAQALTWAASLNRDSGN